jgi:hypothetical protein
MVIDDRPPALRYGLRLFGVFCIVQEGAYRKLVKAGDKKKRLSKS